MVDSSASQNVTYPRLEDLSGPHEAAVFGASVEPDDTVDLTTAGVPQTADLLKATQPVASSSQRPEPLAHESKDIYLKGSII